MRAALLLLALSAPPSSAQPASPVLGGVVKSREWRVRRAPEREEEFIGEVSYRSPEGVVESDWALFEHRRRLWRARGRVRVERTLETGERLTAAGDEARFEQGSGEGSLSGKSGVAFQRLPLDGEPDHGSAGRLEWSAREEVRLERGVRVWGPRLEAAGDRGRYDRATEVLRLTGGRPTLKRLSGFTPSEAPWTGAVQADEVAASRRDGRVAAEGSARGWIVFPRPEGAGKR